MISLASSCLAGPFHQDYRRNMPLGIIAFMALSGIGSVLFPTLVVVSPPGLSLDLAFSSLPNVYLLQHILGDTK